MRSIDSQWAWSQIEAMADGSLSSGDVRRMREAMAREPALAAAVARARALRRELGTLGRTPVPASLTGRLLAIPSSGENAGRAPSTVMSWSSATVAASLFAAAVLALMQPRLDEAYEHEREQAYEARAALRDLEHTLIYVRRSSVTARDEVEEAVGRTVRNALERGLAALSDDASGAVEQGRAGQGDEPRQGGG